MSLLQFDQAVKHYSDAEETVRAVDGVDLSVEPGEMLALYGPSGSGKSTLLLLAAGFLTPDAGQVRFMGTDLSEMTPGNLAAYQRRDVGIVYQSPHLIKDIPAVENAAIKLLLDGVTLRDACKMAEPWLARVGLEHRLRHTPDRLSGGERQRVAVARALVNEPRLILADEPTGSVESRRGRQILQLLSEVATDRKAAVLLVTHDPQAAGIADRVLSLRDGQLCRTPTFSAGVRDLDLAAFGLTREPE